MRRLAAAGLALAAVAALLFLLRGTLATAVMGVAAERAVRADATGSLPDGLHLLLCGSGSPIPDPERSGPCLTVVAGRTIFVVDAGSGGARNLRRMGVPIGRVAAVFLTHYHSDHLDGLGELGLLRWVGAANAQPLPVYGPPGLEEVVAGFDQAYRLDARYRTAHHGGEVAPPEGAGLVARPFEPPADGTPVVVWDSDGVRISAFTVDHAPVEPAVGYRFDYGGRSLVISGDTRRSAAVEARAKGADLLVHEALSPELVGILNRAAARAGDRNLERITHDIPDYHTTPVEAAGIASASGVGALLLYHVVPPLPLPGLEAAFLRGVGEAWDGRVVLGRDGTLVSLPAGGEEIRFSSLP